MKKPLKDFQNLTITPCQQMAIKGGDNHSDVPTSTTYDYVGTVDVIDG